MPLNVQTIIDYWNAKAEVKYKGDAWIIENLCSCLASQITPDHIFKAIDNYITARKLKDTLSHNFNLPKFLRRLMQGHYGYLDGYFHLEDYCHGKPVFRLTPEEKAERLRQQEEKRRQDFIQFYEPIFSQWNNDRLTDHANNAHGMDRWLARKILEERKSQE